MANTFKQINFAAEPNSAGTPYVVYTTASSTTTVIIGLMLTNIHTTSVTTEVELVSTTANRGGANNVANGTSFLVKDVSIPNGSTLELLTGGKVVMEAGDALRIDCSVATGTIWVDNGTSGKLKVKINDGSDNVELFEIDISSNAITSNMSVTGTITETDPNALPLALALG